MRRFKVWFDKQVSGSDGEEEVLEFPDDATDEDIHEQCQDWIEAQINNTCDSGWEEIDPKPKKVVEKKPVDVSNLGRVNHGEIDRALKEGAAYKSLAEGLDKLLVSYRTGGAPSEATWKKIDSARKKLAKLQGGRLTQKA